MNDSKQSMELQDRDNNFSTKDGISPTLEKYLLSSAFVVISLTSMIGNTLVLMAVCTNRRLWITSNYLLAALAVPDFFQGAISIPLRLVEILVTDHDHDLRKFCQVAIPLSAVFGGTSNLHILLITIERFVAIRWPFFYFGWIARTKFALGGAGIAWLMLSVYSLLPVIGWGARQPLGHVTFCRFPLFLTQEYIMLLFIFAHAIPILAVAFLNMFILRASILHEGRIQVQVNTAQLNSDINTDLHTFQQNPTSSQNSRRFLTDSLKQRKATRIVVMVVGVFIVLVVPIIIIDVIEMVEGPLAPPLLVKIAVLMIYANQCVNVFLYAGCNSDFRKTFKRIIIKSVRLLKCRCL